MPGGFGDRGKPLHEQTTYELCEGIVGPLLVLGIMFGVTLLATSTPASTVWLLRTSLIALLAFFTWRMAWPRIGELRRRREPDA